MVSNYIVFQVVFSNFQNTLHNFSCKDAFVCGVGNKALNEYTRLTGDKTIICTG